MQGRYKFYPIHFAVQEHLYIDLQRLIYIYINSECMHGKTDEKSLVVIEQLSCTLFEKERLLKNFCYFEQLFEQLSGNNEQLVDRASRKTLYLGKIRKVPHIDYVIHQQTSGYQK